MTRRPPTFSKTDYVRAVESAQACGLPITRSEIARDGSIILYHGDTTTAVPDATQNFDFWKAKKDAHST